jgi:HEAT repeat protein
VILALALLAGLAGAQSADPPAAAARKRAQEEISILRRGDWNARVHATSQLGELGVDGLAGLRVAAEDADWQVRMTAVHFMGRVGAQAVPDLARVMEVEPCRHVRLIALNWLGAIATPEASEALRRGLGDESGMVRLMGRYWLGKEGEEDESDGADAAAASEEDLKHCASSAGPGLLAARPSAADEAPSVHEAGAPNPSPRPKSDAEAVPETLPESPSVASRPETAQAAANIEPLERERLRELDELLEPREKPDAESFPPGTPGLERPAPETGDAAIMPDAGTGKAAVDPLPALKRLLLDADPRKRARAADELGRRGAAAVSAETALIAALKDRDRRVRASAALALGNLGAAADSAVPSLVAALKRGPEDVERSAAVALGRIGTPRARRAFARYARQSAGDFLKREGGEAK